MFAFIFIYHIQIVPEYIVVHHFMYFVHPKPKFDLVWKVLHFCQVFIAVHGPDRVINPLFLSWTESDEKSSILTPLRWPFKGFVMSRGGVGLMAT